MIDLLYLLILILHLQQKMIQRLEQDVAQIEDDRYKLEVKEPNNLLCQQQNLIVKMCIRPECPRASLICSKKECQSCKKDEHKKCPQIYLEGLAESLNQHIETKKYILKEMRQTENKFISSLGETNNRFFDEIRLAGLDQKSKRIAQQIFDKKNNKALKGKEACQFFNNVNKYETSKPSMKEIQNIFKGYDKTLQKVLENAVQTKQLLCKALCSKVNKNINLKTFDSNILTIDQKHSDILKAIVNDPIKVERADLLFRASEHNFSAAAFHEKCDNKNDTLIIIRTEFGKTIGGYTHYPWDSGSLWLSDSNRRTFIFSLDMGEKFIPQRDETLILRYNNYGPVFGGGYDIHISDGCNKKDNSYASFPTIYNREGQNKLVQSEETYCQFSGGYHFKVVEYEVFQLFYE